MSDGENQFSLNTNNESFQQRQKSVFDQLAVLERNRVNTMDVDESQYSEETSSQPDQKYERAYTKHFSGKKSIFKKPSTPKTAKNFMRRMPDFKKNPHKWTKYSLDDVRDEDISDKGNTRAALSFLKELESRKKRENDMEQQDDDKPKIMFRRKASPPPEAMAKEGTSDEKPGFNSSKVVMPEYVIGQKVKKEKSKKEKVDKGKQLRLDHLLEEDE